MRILMVSELLNLMTVLREVRASKNNLKNTIKAVGTAKIFFLLCGF